MKKVLEKYMKKDTVNLFIFRRDLRIHDNLAFIDLLNQCQEENVPLVPIFIFNPDQIDPSKNQYFSKNCVEFMIQSLKNLSSDLFNCLYFFHGHDIDILNKLLSIFDINTIGFNEDFTPFSIQRDKDIIKWCESKGIHTVTAQDYTLFPLGSILTGNGKAYEVFTPFYNNCLNRYKDVPKPIGVPSNMKHSLYKNMTKLKPYLVKDISKYYDNDPNPNLMVKGGRDNALDIIRRIKAGEFLRYDNERDFPAADKTTKLSAYMKFGCVSVREVFYAIKDRHGVKHGLLREIIWREFYANITYSFSHVLNGQIQGHNKSFKPKYDKLRWGYNQDWFEKWCKGVTGVPLVDAAMRQLNTTGWMHNRCRMVVSMFLTKDMLIDWRMGEHYFATQLVDYDPSSNNGGWQWSASTGCDAQPYFRIFNPYTQSEKFDPKAEYIKKWIPELRDVSPKDIHSWDKTYSKYNNSGYPRPLVNHTEQSKKAISIFKNIN
jgi:deoxyribodipyrimidine photo-lyase